MVLRLLGQGGGVSFELCVHKHKLANAAYSAFIKRCHLVLFAQLVVSQNS